MKLPLDRDQIYTPNNGLKVLCLIKELAKPDDEPIFTLRDEKDGFESLQVLFINLVTEDPTESTFAQVVFGDVLYWMKARENKLLKPHLEEWRKVADVKRKAMAYEAIIGEVKTRGKNCFSAAKFIIDEPNKDKRNPKVKESVEESKAKAKEQSLYSEDLQNIKGLLDEQKSYTN